jgi:hypothetical protein
MFEFRSKRHQLNVLSRSQKGFRQVRQGGTAKAIQVLCPKSVFSRE